MKFNSWKTTLGGIVSILTALGMFGKILNDFGNGESVNLEQVGVAVAAISGGIGLLFARDNNVTSEEAGAARPYYGGLHVLVLIPAILLTGCPKANETIRDFKNNSAKAKIYAIKIQQANIASFDAGDLTKDQLRVLTQATAKFRDGIKALDAGIRQAEVILRDNPDGKRTALDMLDRVLTDEVMTAFDQMIAAITGVHTIDSRVEGWINTIRIALAALRAVLAGVHNAGAQLTEA